MTSVDIGGGVLSGFPSLKDELRKDSAYQDQIAVPEGGVPAGAPTLPLGLDFAPGEAANPATSSVIKEVF